MINSAGVILQTFGTVFSQRVLSVLEKHKNDEITIETAKEFLFDMLEPTIDRGDMDYRFEHSVRVAENTKIIAMAEGFNEMDLVIA